MVDFRDPGKVVRQTVSGEILKAFALGIFESYAVRDKHQIFPDAQMHDAWPIMRRGLIEARLAKIALDYPALACSVQKNRAGASNFVRIDAGPIVIIESKVASADDAPRPADLRDELAQGNTAYLPGMSDLAPPASQDAELCAMLIHSPDPSRPDRPWFIDMVFPTPDGKGYLGERLHLLPELSESEVRPEAAEEKVAEDLPIGFRDDIPKEERA